ncbi:MAG: Asp-tRNA(Asn)/Glu-tRNA(Gln) amidotransferase GatCAB subunit C, partial [Actinomycetota bacterium]|nr:Asp-tRNA(Asn)/Glu-tRNA(Gln) amidotransferase GatCAB subunit C [Actinomycetota bacterium]
FEAVGREPPRRPFPRLPWHEVIARYGSDKPDLRFGLEIEDATDVTRGSQFGVFAGAEAVRFLSVPQAFSRAELARLESVAREWGAKGLAYIVYDEEGQPRSPIVKFLSEDELARFRAEPSSTVLFGADAPATVARVLGGIRAQLGRELGLVDAARQALLWVVDFPLFEWSEDERRWTFSHHPFTGVMPGHEALIESDPGAALSQAYDLVWNGWELGSGSIRIHDQATQGRIFRALGLSDEEAEEKFGFLLEALRMGAPPHGGFALGIDRFVALMAGEPNIREIVGFPKVSSGADPLTGAPTPMPPETLREVGIRALADRS